MTTATAVPAAARLTAHDRCDGCGAQARVTALKGALSLLLCGHHANRHGDRLTAEGWITITSGASE